MGKKIAAATAGTGKGLSLELGGKSPHIIFEDASLDQAIEGVIAGIYFNQGEVCCAGSRLLVQESILPEVIARLELRLASLRVGDPLDKNTDVGAINSREQLPRQPVPEARSRRGGATFHEPGSTLPGSRATAAARASSATSSRATQSHAKRSSAPCSAS